MKNCRDLKQNLEDLLSMQPLTDRPYSEISFGDDHVQALAITDKICNNLPSKTNALKKIKLSKDIIDVTQYDKDGIKILYNDANCVTLNQGHDISHNNSMNNINTNTSMNSIQIDPLSPPINNQDNNNSKDSDLIALKLNKCNDDKESLNSSFDNGSTKNISSSLEKSPRPRLIRSNSYTLETPSPILLAHLEKTERSNKHEIKNLEDIKNLSISRNWSSLENNYIPFENSEFSSINTVYDANLNCPSNENIHSNTPIGEQYNVERSASPAIKVIQTDISVQKITVNANNEIINDSLDENCTTSDSQLLQVLKTLPDIYAKQIIELMETQKLERQKLTEHKGEPQNNNKPNVQVIKKEDPNTVNGNIVNGRNDSLHNFVSNTDMKNGYQNSLHQSISFSGSEKLQGSTTSISPSQSIYYSVTSSDTVRPLSNSSMQLIDFDCDDMVVSEKMDFPRKTDITEYYVPGEVQKQMNISRDLFPQLNGSTIRNIKQVSDV